MVCHAAHPFLLLTKNTHGGCHHTVTKGLSPEQRFFENEAIKCHKLMLDGLGSVLKKSWVC